MKRIPDEVLNVLMSMQFDGNAAKITSGQLARPLYVAVNKVLEACEGKWNRKAGAHLFPSDAAELMGDVIASGQYVDAKTEFQFFETPDDLAVSLAQSAGIEPGMSVLEPSAGRGAIARACDAAGGTVHCVEINPAMAETLTGYPTTCADFLRIPTLQLYDRVVMNPPFSKSQDIAHVRHAYQFLKPGGRIVAVMGVGWTFRSDRKAVEFREWLNSIGGHATALPDGSFKSAGTGVRTVFIVAHKA